MAIGTSDRDALVMMMFEVCGEDYMVMARLLAKLETRFGTVAWRARIVALAPTYAPFVASGLSIGWWTSEVSRLADAYK
jgi:hypothetical protein